FGGSEAVWGCTPGKRWLGLRVTSVAAAERPGTFRVLLRVVVFLLLLNLGFYASQILLLAGIGRGADGDVGRAMLESLAMLATIGILEPLGIGLLMCTMRAHNGYRGLHEILTGTRVVRLPDSAERR